MYTLLPALTESQIEELVKLRGELTLSESTGARLRVGKNILKKQSKYSYSRWFSWNRHQRALYKSIIPGTVVGRAVQCWFLELEPVNGFLDVMTYWVDKPSSGTVVAYALQDDMCINLNGHVIQVPKGEGIAFHLSTIHSIPETPEGQLWACVMLRGCYTTCKPE